MQFDWFNFILGLVVGIITNLVAWWMLFHGIVPKASFSSSISKTTIKPDKSDKSGYRYRVKFENKGWRSIIDMEVTAKAVVKGIGPYKETTYQTVLLPLTPNGGLSYRIPRLRPIRQGSMFRHIIRFYLNAGAVLLTPAFFPKDIHRKLNRKTLRLEDLFASSEESYIEVQAFGYDEFSGSRKYFRSKLYRITDILEGPFDKDGLEVKSERGTDEEIFILTLAEQ